MELDGFWCRPSQILSYQYLCKDSPVRNVGLDNTEVPVWISQSHHHRSVSIHRGHMGGSYGAFLKDVSKIMFVNSGISGNVMLDPIWMPMSTKAALTLPSWAGQGRENVIENQDTVPENSLSNCPHREDKESPKSHHTNSTQRKNCTCWWLKYCFLWGNPLGVWSLLSPVSSIQAVFTLCELCPGCHREKGGERNQML